MRSAKGIGLPTQWSSTWRKQQRVAFFKKAIRWGADAITEYNASLGKRFPSVPATTRPFQCQCE